MASARHSDLAAAGEILLDDRRFRALLSDEDWGRLPLATWRRFSKRLAGGRTIVYVGEVEEVRHSRIGWWVAQFVRIIGGPLPTGTETQVPIIVTVTEDAASGGQVWTRICARSNGFPQVIHSAKRFAGATGLEEYVGLGISMALSLRVENGTLKFESAGYSLSLGRLRLPLLARLAPGALTVSHTDLGGGAFRFTLVVTHARWGELLCQSAVFWEVAS
jgi:Domain of unknown function (DUF4166)